MTQFTFVTNICCLLFGFAMGSCWPVDVTAPVVIGVFVACMGVSAIRRPT